MDDDDDDYNYVEDEYNEDDDFDFDDADDDEEVVKARLEAAGVKDTDDLRTNMENVRKNGTHLFRCVNMRDGKIIKVELGAICSASYKTGPQGRYESCWSKADTFGLIYNGEAQESGHGSAPKGMLSGGEISLAWLKFLLDPNESPWADVIPCITNRDDVDWINEKGGFIIENFDQVGANVFGAFVIATRWPQEHPEFGKRWFDHVKSGMNPRLAFIFASTCDATGKAVGNTGHMPHSDSSLLWMKACWERKGTPGRPVSESGFAGGDLLYVSRDSPEYKAMYGYNAKASEAFKMKLGKADEVLSQIKERINYVEQ